MATGTYENIIIMATETYKKIWQKNMTSIWKNIGDISICENTTGTCGKNTYDSNMWKKYDRNMWKNMTGTCGKIIIMATGTYEKIDDRNMKK